MLIKSKKCLARFKVETSINNDRKGLWIIGTRIRNPVKHLRWRFHISYSEHFILGVSQYYEYASIKTKENPGALSFISREIRTSISANLF